MLPDNVILFGLIDGPEKVEDLQMYLPPLIDYLLRCGKASRLSMRTRRRRSTSARYCTTSWPTAAAMPAALA